MDVASLEVAREDLARLLLMGFTLIYANDFFLVPIELSVSSLCRITGSKVLDTFGEAHQVTAAQTITPGSSGAASWRMY